MTDQRLLCALDDLSKLNLGATEKAAVQLILIVQNFLRSDWRNMSTKPFEDWSVAEICCAMKIKLHNEPMKDAA